MVPPAVLQGPAAGPKPHLRVPELRWPETLNPVPHFASAPALYLDLVEKCLTNTIYGDGYTGVGLPGVEGPFDARLREFGRDWPRRAHTMIGRVRLRNLRQLVETAIREGVPGDLIETGVWRGGACILMRAALEAYGDLERRVFVADSFAGLPPPNENAYPADRGDLLHTIEELAVPLEEVKENFAKYGLLGDRVVFLKGWFKDTLRAAPIDRLAVLRLNGDMYESTMARSPPSMTRCPRAASSLSTTMAASRDAAPPSTLSVKRAGSRTGSSISTGGASTGARTANRWSIARHKQGRHMQGRWRHI
jgi:hypothetical protein